VRSTDRNPADPTLKAGGQSGQFSPGRRSAFGTVIRAGSTTAGVRKPVASFSRGQTGAIAPVGSGGPSGEMLADGTFDPSLYGRPSSSIVVE